MEEMNEMDWMSEYAGAGQDTVGTTKSTPYLTLIQPDSTLETPETPAGTWKNSSNGQSYGKTVRVIPLAFHTVWAERADGDGGFRTIARYKPQSIQVEVRQPKAGKRGFPKMYSVESGNEIQEQYIYALLLPDHLDAGMLYYNPSSISMKTCRNWNSQLFSQLLPNGAQAPIFAYAWNLFSDMVQNPQQPNKQCAKLVTVTKDVITSKDIFTASVKPLLEVVRSERLLIEAGGQDDAQDSSAE